MLAGVYSAASALRTAEFHQDVIATNLAHLNVPGFRRSMMTVSAYQDDVNAPNQSPGFGNNEESLSVDFTSGPNVTTDRSLDVAINGDGFFAVQGENEVLYTRSGSFQVGEGGVLVGNHGMPVLGESGPISLPNDVSPGQIVISSEGTISVGGDQLGQLRLTRFQNNAALKPVGTTLFSADQAQVSAEDVTVIQGMREQSNVKPVDELVSMIVAMRYHEAAQRTLRSIDGTIEQQTDPRG